MMITESVMPMEMMMMMSRLARRCGICVMSYFLFFPGVVVCRVKGRIFTLYAMFIYSDLNHPFFRVLIYLHHFHYISLDMTQ